MKADMKNKKSSKHSKKRRVVDIQVEAIASAATNASTSGPVSADQDIDPETQRIIDLVEDKHKKVLFETDVARNKSQKLASEASGFTKVDSKKNAASRCSCFSFSMFRQDKNKSNNHDDERKALLSLARN